MFLKTVDDCLEYGVCLGVVSEGVQGGDILDFLNILLCIFKCILKFGQVFSELGLAYHLLMLVAKIVAQVKTRIPKLTSLAGVCPTPDDSAMLTYLLKEMNMFAIRREWSYANALRLDFLWQGLELLLYCMYCGVLDAVRDGAG